MDIKQVIFLCMYRGDPSSRFVIVSYEDGKNKLFNKVDSDVADFIFSTDCLIDQYTFNTGGFLMVCRCDPYDEVPY